MTRPPLALTVPHLSASVSQATLQTMFVKRQPEMTPSAISPAGCEPLPPIVMSRNVQFSTSPVMTWTKRPFERSADVPSCVDEVKVIPLIVAPEPVNSKPWPVPSMSMTVSSRRPFARRATFAGNSTSAVWALRS